jgi:hypothetical protein
MPKNESERSHHEAVMTREAGNISTGMNILYSEKLAPGHRFKVEVERETDYFVLPSIWKISIWLVDKVGKVIIGPKIYSRSGASHDNDTSAPFNTNSTSSDF